MKKFLLVPALCVLMPLCATVRQNLSLLAQQLLALQAVLKATEQSPTWPSLDAETKSSAAAGASVATDQPNLFSELWSALHDMKSAQNVDLVSLTVPLLKFGMDWDRYKKQYYEFPESKPDAAFSIHDLFIQEKIYESNDEQWKKNIEDANKVRQLVHEVIYNKNNHRFVLIKEMYDFLESQEFKDQLAAYSARKDRERADYENSAEGKEEKRRLEEQEKEERRKQEQQVKMAQELKRMNALFEPLRKANFFTAEDNVFEAHQKLLLREGGPFYKGRPFKDLDDLVKHVEGQGTRFFINSLNKLKRLNAQGKMPPSEQIVDLIEWFRVLLTVDKQLFDDYCSWPAFSDEERRIRANLNSYFEQAFDYLDMLDLLLIFKHEKEFIDFWPTNSDEATIVYHLPSVVNRTADAIIQKIVYDLYPKYGKALAEAAATGNETAKKYNDLFQTYMQRRALL